MPALLEPIAPGSGRGYALDADSPAAELVRRVDAQLQEDIRALGGNPAARGWQGWDLRDLARAASLARELAAKYGAKMTVKPRGRQPGGRPRKLTEEEEEEAAARLVRGVTQQAAADFAGVSVATIRRLRERYLKEK